MPLFISDNRNKTVKRKKKKKKEKTNEDFMKSASNDPPHNFI